MKKPKVLGHRPSAERRRERDAERRSLKPWRSWYGLAVWKAIRERQLDAEPLCRRCKAKGFDVLATVVNHVIPHRGDWERFISGPFESLCKPCHDGEVQAEEKAAGRLEAARRSRPL